MMESIKTWEAGLAALGLEFKGVIAGAVGAFISLNFFKDLKLWERWTTFTGGWALAAWGAGPITTAFELKSSTFVGIALAIGLFGMALTGKLMQTLRETDWIGFVKTVLRLMRGGG